MKREQQDKLSGSKKGGDSGYDVRKSGDSSAVLIGLPSVGKSTILNSLTDKDSPVGHFAFTTLEAIPGILHHKGAQIQIIDLPGIISGASKGKGRGKQVLGVARSADLILMVLDVFQVKTQYELIERELFYFGIRLDRKKPDVVIQKTVKGGISIASLMKLTKINDKTIKSVLNEYKIINADITIRTDIDVDELIDVIEGNRVYIDSMIIFNKIDLMGRDLLEKTKKDFENTFRQADLLISADNNLNMDLLKDEIFRNLKLIRLYMKPQGKDVDWEEPLIMRTGTSIGNVCDKLHRRFRTEFKYARVWGKSIKHDGGKANLKHVLIDEDVLSIITSAK